MQFASNDFINYEAALADQEQESEIGGVVSKMQAGAAEDAAEVESEQGAAVAENQANAGIFDANAGVSTEGEVAKSDIVSPLTNAKYRVATAKKAQKRIRENEAKAERARFKFDETKKDTNQEMRKGVPNGSLADATRSVSNNSIPQNSDLSTGSEKKMTENVILRRERTSLQRQRRSRRRTGEMTFILKGQ